MCSNLTIAEVICAVCVDENGDGLLLQKSSNFHYLRVGVAGQRVHCVVGRLVLFLCGFFFDFEAFFRWFAVLILHRFNHEKPALFAVMFAAPRGTDGSRGSSRPWNGWSRSEPCPSCLM
ncbi:hypothetical protein GW17_00061878 [Ensete ventricosum]|nr:hypothetical protein GW17_00061878 [Ensete ventricosum]